MGACMGQCGRYANASDVRVCTKGVRATGIHACERVCECMRECAEGARKLRKDVCECVREGVGDLCESAGSCEYVGKCVSVTMCESECANV